ncbi:uncharacterized protein BXZ73DRAFT_99479 [Epithele typhae]|uniref:uncharacterized protein n=1 Tax=Epithele typhae TaxID=378194 RepID=UPI0020081246|nr:uncharacterized protein BXZ73DRAFT_99479 [Epithele typhae]KAH9939275.1 hypothetical protein BXZ73DRAFT_99479 [Epithele typhae]
MDPPSLPSIPALDNTFGALLVGTFVGLVLYGITLLQALNYFCTYPHDPRLLKFVVPQYAAPAIRTVYHYVTEVREPDFDADGCAMLITIPSFFARRVCKLGSGFRIIVGLAILLCVVMLGFFVATTAKAVILPTFDAFDHVTWLISAGFTAAVVADLLLTAVLIFVLGRNRTGYHNTDSAMDLIALYAINTGALTGAVNILSLVFAFVQSDNLIYVGIGIPSAKLYTNTLLAALNSRETISKVSAGIC